MKKITILLLLSVWTSLLLAQTAAQSLIHYIKNVNQFSESVPQEKVYLHFDNTGYYLGETIWFKAYVVGAPHIDSTLVSKVLHVELLTPQGQVIGSRKLLIKNGQCHGDFRLVANRYRSGFYEVRAYTRGMLNFGDDCVFSRVFPVYNAPETAGDYADKKMDAARVLTSLRKKNEKSDRLNLTFYPEGGQAIVGLRSRIAFKATNKEGQEVEVSGTVCDAQNRSVAVFSTLHQGMGCFELIPETGEYKVVAECDGRKQTFPLTGIKAEGYVMRLDEPDGGEIRLQLQKSSSLLSDTLGVSVSCRGKVLSMGMVCLANEPYDFRLSKSKLPEGCLQFTLFDKHGNILAERLFFNVGRVECCAIESKQRKAFYKPLERVRMEFEVKDKEGSPVNTTFSLAIRDAGTELHTSYQGNILTDLLLSSDVKGYIENPMQYFVNPDTATRARLDLLMLVQGWRRYDWAVMAGVAPFNVKCYAEEGLDISGRVLGVSKTGKPLQGDIKYWILAEGSAWHGKGKTDENGKFHFTLPDSAKIGEKWPLGLLFSVNGKQKGCRMLLDRFGPQGKAYSFHDEWVKDTSVVFELPTDSLKKELVDDIHYLDEAVIRAERLRPDIVLDVEKDITALQDRGEEYRFSLEEYLLSRVPAISPEGGNKYGGQRTFYCYQTKRNATLGQIRNGMMNLSTIDIDDVYSIHIYYKNKLAWMKVADPNGGCYNHAMQSAIAVFVFLKDDGLHDQYRPGIRQTFYNGYSRVREFYHMDNSNKLPGEADLRRTLYWNPDVKTDRQGKVKISFYNSSKCRQMTVSAEGITEQGVFLLGE